MSGIAVGAGEVIDRAKTIVGHNVAIRLNNIQLSCTGFALSLHNEAERDGVKLDENVALVCTLSDGKISVIKSFLSDLPGMDKFFGGELLHASQLDEPRPGFEQKSAVANTFLSAMKANDWDLMRSVMMPGVKWTLPGTSLLSGPAEGVDAVIKRAQSLKKFGVMFRLIDVLYGWDGVALALNNTGKRGELILDEYVTIVFQLNGGKVSCIITQLSDVPGINNFFVSGVIE